VFVGKWFRFREISLDKVTVLLAMHKYLKILKPICLLFYLCDQVTFH